LFEATELLRLPSGQQPYSPITFAVPESTDQGQQSNRQAKFAQTSFRELPHLKGWLVELKKQI
jgi:hypothetical protein